MKYSNVDKEVEVGDWVEYKGEIGEVKVVTLSSALFWGATVKLECGSVKRVQESLTYISSYKNKPNKHWRLIEAWGKGAAIECKAYSSEIWVESSHPEWYEQLEYRIQPDKSPAQLEKESIQKEMEKLSKRLEELDISGDK